MFSMEKERSVRLRTLLRPSRSARSVFSLESAGNGRGRGLGVRHFQVTLLTMALAMNSLGHLTETLVIEKASSEDPNWSNIEFPPEWASGTVIFGAFSYFISGLLTTKVNNKYLLASAVFLNIVTINFTHFVFESGSLSLLTLLRFTKAFADAFVPPTVLNILTQWVPDDEESLLLPLALTGQPLGFMIGFFSTVDLSESSGGSLSPLYFSTFFSLVWFIAFLGLGAQEPRLCWYISNSEQRYIERNRTHKTQGLYRKHIPYISILKCLPIYAIVVATVAMYYYSYVFTGFIAQRLASHYSLSKAFTVIGLGSLTKICCSFIITVIAHNLIIRRYLTKKTVRFISTGIALAGCGMSNLIMEPTRMDNVIAQFFLNAFLEGFLNLGSGINNFDLVPNFIGLVEGWTGIVTALLQLTFPPLKSALEHNFTPQVAHLAIFQISGLILILGNLFYMMFASVEPEPLNFIQDENDEVI